jgi:hypothetical protein
MRRVRRFAEGDIVEEGLGVFNPDNASYARRAPKNRTIDDMSFGEAFALKRKELGEGKTFTWRGEKYTTSTKKPKTEAELPKAAPPTARPKPTETKAAPKADVKTVTKPLSSKQEESFGRRLGEGFLDKANRGMRAAGVPAQQRTFLTTLAGSKRPITEKDFSDEELAQLKFAADRAKKAGRKYITYEDYPNELLINKAEQFSKSQAMPQTVGRARLKEKDGKTSVSDIYDFLNSVRAPEVERYKNIRKKEGKTGVAKAVAKEALEDYEKEGFKSAFNKLPSRIGNAFIGEEGRPVEIAMRRGGAVKDKVRGYGIAQKGRGRGRFVR